MKAKIRKVVNNEKVSVSKEILPKEILPEVINDKADLIACFTIFVTLYNIIKENESDYLYGVKFCVDEGINLVRKHYPNSCWKDEKKLITDEGTKTQSDVTKIDISQLNCPCYNCSDWNETYQRCKNIQKDCITYCNWYSNTFKN